MIRQLHGLQLVPLLWVPSDSGVSLGHELHNLFEPAEPTHGIACEMRCRIVVATGCEEWRRSDCLRPKHALPATCTEISAVRSSSAVN